MRTAPLVALLALGCRPTDKTDTAPATVTGVALAISDSGHGRIVFTDPTRAARTGESCLAEIIGDLCPTARSATDTADTGPADFARCLTFGVRHEVEDGQDVLELAYARYLDGEEDLPGALTRYIPTHPPTVAFDFDTITFADGPLASLCTGPSTDPSCGFRMPHAQIAAADPGQRIVADTLNSRVLWVAPPASGSIGAGLHVLDGTVPGWGEALYPNNVELHEHDGRTYLLVTYKGSDRAVSGNSELGRIMLWDVSDPAAPAQVWAYPPAGYLAASHGGVIRTVYGQEVLLYAHAYGASGDLDAPDDGSVGLALMSWDSPPTYLGDLVLPSSDPSPLGFVRAVDVLDPGPTDGGATGTDRATLLVTDSGCENQEGECNRPVGILEVALDPLPEPPGVTGAFSGDHADQRMIEVREATDPYRDSLKFPFQALPIPEADLAGVLTDGPGACP